MGLAKLSCFLWGHHVDNHVFKQADATARRCRCGSEYLAEDRSITRVRHTLSCFLGKHDYEKLADRDGCHEYVCTQCGHPLLFDAGREIRCHSDVQRIVTASKDIDPHETTMPSSVGVDQSGLGDVGMPFDSRLRRSLRTPFAGLP